MRWRINDTYQSGITGIVLRAKGIAERYAEDYFSFHQQKSPMSATNVG
jgi:hypothetical protein